MRWVNPIFVCCISDLVDAVFMKCQRFDNQESNFYSIQPRPAMSQWNQYDQYQQSEVHPHTESMANGTSSLSSGGPQHLLSDLALNSDNLEAPQTQQPENKHRRKVHACPICGKASVCQSNLVTHMRVHSGERPFKCQICGKGFTQTSNLNRHVATSHHQ